MINQNSEQITSTMGNGISFSRPSNAYKKSGKVVRADSPRYETGYIGNGLLIEESTYNHVIPFSVITWDRNTTNTTLTMESMSFNNASVFKFQTNTSGTSINSFLRLNMTPTVGQPYAFTSYVKKLNHRYIGFRCFGSGATGNSQSVLDLDTGSTYNNNAEQIITATPLNDGWWKVVVTNNNVQTSSPYSGFCLPSDTTGGEVIAGADGRGVYISNTLHVENKKFATSYCPSGTSRTQELITFNPNGIINIPEGTIEATTYIDVQNAHKSGTNWNMIFSTATIINSPYAEQNHISIRKSSANQQWSLYIGDAIGSGSNQLVIPYGVITTSGWYTFVATWKTGVGASIYLNGSLIRGAVATDPLPVALNPIAHIGSWVGGGLQLNSVLDEFRISKVARTASEIADNYNNKKPLTQDANTTLLLDNNRGTLPYANGNLGL